MAVDEAYRGHGLGSQLLEKCIERARSEGASELILETNSALGSAVNLYRKMGFQEIEGRHQSKFSRVNMAMRLALTAKSNDKSHDKLNEVEEK